MSWIIRLRRRKGDVALKIARPDGPGARGGLPGLDHASRNALIEHEVAVRRRLGASAVTPPLLDAGSYRGSAYFITPWIRGDGRGLAGSREAERESMRALSAVAALHISRVAHCDLEPNHVLTGDEHVWLIDFGRARLFDATDTRGGVRRDVFSMGCYLAERLLGLPRFPYRAQHEVAHACRVTDELPRTAIGLVIARALASMTGQADAYTTVSALRGGLAAALSLADSEDSLSRELGADRP